MRITNADGLPQIVVDALRHDTYKVAGDISVTTLIDAPQIRYLKRKYGQELEEDAADMLWALMGTAVHNILERAHIQDYRKRAFLVVIDTLQKSAEKFNEGGQLKLKELCSQLHKMMEYLFPEVAGRYLWEMTLQYDHNGMLLYGTFDVYDKIDKILYDYKLCSVWAYAYPESRRKWHAQTNVYAFMLREAGHEVNGIFIVAIFRDWSASKVEYSKLDYPKTQLMTIPVDVQDHEKIRNYIHSKILLHQAADNGDVQPCSGVDMWATATEYAVKKQGLARAVRKFTTEDQAETFIRNEGHKFTPALTLEIRPGERKRCEAYCPVSAVCPQKKRMDEEDAAREKCQ